MTSPDADDTLIAQTIGRLPTFSATELASELGSITRTVLRAGAAVITKHQEPVMVLLSIERYAQLEQAATPNLGALSRRFEDLYARMQVPGVAGRTVQSLDLTTRRTEQQQPRKRNGRRSA